MAWYNWGHHDVGPPGAAPGLGVPGVAAGFYKVGIYLFWVMDPPDVEARELVAG